MIKNPSEIKIFITRDIPVIGIELLKKEGFNVSVWPNETPMKPNELIEEGKKANAMLTVLTDSIDKAFLNECSHLDVISQFAVGYDNIDIAEATRLGIPVGYAPGAMSDATADVAFGLMIAVSRKMFYMHKTIAKGEWAYFKPKANLGIELKNKTLGILGLGRIGLQMAMRCKGAYNMKIIYHNRKPNAEAEKLLNASMVSFEKLLQQSDVLSVHAALNDETRGIFNKNAFQKMKSNSIFINTARGGLHNEQDLIEALNAGNIWGAGLDVTNPEPMDAKSPLLSMPNVAVLPHIGSATVEARNEMSRLAATNIIEFYKHNKIPNIVNPETLSASKNY
ncbi:MAG TPA: D-glycerate dehydrogenase [Chitinophagaceae bacterium]|jgi:glyoxylate reductase|nr:D-glycerate dehydrogenase [Chitinophagaceae bacterium]